MHEYLIGRQILGFCNGYLGRDDYGLKHIVGIGDRWFVVEYEEDKRLMLADFNNTNDMEHWLKEWGVL